MTEREIIFRINRIEDVADIPQTNEIRRLSIEDRAIFNRHLGLCRQARASVSEEEWQRWNAEGIEFYMLFADGIPVARCSIEKYSEDKWEAADVRTVREYRGRGYAREIVAHVTRLILAQGKTATCRTLSENAAMLRVMETVGYQRLSERSALY